MCVFRGGISRVNVSDGDTNDHKKHTNATATQYHPAAQTHAPEHDAQLLLLPVQRHNLVFFLWARGVPHFAELLRLFSESQVWRQSVNRSRKACNGRIM